MKKLSTILATLFLFFGMAQAQDVYFSGNSNGTGKIWKNNTLIYSISDTISVDLSALQIAADNSVYSAGYVHDSAYEFVQGRIWLNDNIAFTADSNTAITNMVLNGNTWTAAGIGENEWENVAGLVWQNGTLLYAYSDNTYTNQINALAVDNLTGDIYAGGISSESESKAAVWKNNNLLWREDLVSFIYDIVLDGNDLYAAGCRYIGETNSFATLWKNGSVFFSINDESTGSEFQVVTHYNGSVYTGGYIGNTLYIWQDDEVLYDHPYMESAKINELIVNESGIYYAGQIDGIATVWKDGEILYQPEDCDMVIALCVPSAPPQTVFTLTVEADNTGWGTVTGGGTYNLGDLATIEAFPNIGCQFLYWNDNISNNPLEVLITQDSTFIAHFGLIEYTIATSAMPSEGGIVIGGGFYHYGDTVLLKARSNYGYEFSNWNDGNSDNPRQFIVENDISLTAIFTPLQYVITASGDPEYGGTVEGGGTYFYGETAVLYARPFNDYNFICWSDGIVSNPRYITVTQDASYQALFRYNDTQDHVIKVIANNPDWGTVTGDGVYPEGSIIEISAIPTDSTQFICWSDGITDNPRTVTVTADLVFTAIFEPVPFYTITVKSNSPDMGTVFGSGTYRLNTVINIGAVPEEGFYFIGWQDWDMNNPRTITVTEDAEYMAYFSRTPSTTFTVTVYCDHSEGFILGAGSYNAGATATIAAIPNDGFYFKEWNDGTTENPKEIIVDHDIVMAAFFESLGVDEEGFETISLYPNPANDKIRIVGVDCVHDIQIYNAYGMPVKTASINGESEIDISHLSSGIYFLRMGSHAMKFVKE